MAKKSETVFECASCGHESQKWLGRCPNCGEWNSFHERRNAAVASVSAGRPGERSVPAGAAMVFAKALGNIEIREDSRISTGMGEFDRVLGGGPVRGSSVLLGGEPGIGKSTLMLQSAHSVSALGNVLYVAGEESAEQIKLRSQRIAGESTGADSNIHILASSHLDDVIQAMVEVQPVLVVVDSVQTLFASEAGSTPGSPTQIKFCVYTITEWCRQNRSAVFLVAHVTKDGLIAGPKLLEHMVDTVLYFEEAEAGLRVLRPYKNRYGSTEEIGLFVMDERGLSELLDPYSVLSGRREGELPAGVVSAPVYEGSRVLIIEIQALTVPNKAGFSKVNSDRVDQRRVSRIAAVLEKHAGTSFSDMEIYVNVAGGLKVGDVGLDLALALALFSARTGVPVPGQLAAVGELSLSGELRSVPHLRRRIQAAHDMGIVRALGPRLGSKEGSDKPAGYTELKTIQEALKAVFKGAKPAARQAAERD